MLRSLDAVLDVMRVPASGDAVGRRRAVPRRRRARAAIDCEVLVVGGGTGGVAAALAAARRGRRVVLLEETDWLGGQLTRTGRLARSTSTSTSRRFGGTASYYRLRDALRDALPATRRRRRPRRATSTRATAG